MVDFKCPNPRCRSTLFHVEKAGDDVYEIKCWDTKCGWSMKVIEIRE